MKTFLISFLLLVITTSICAGGIGISKKRSNIYILSIGIDKYPNYLDLKYAVSDANRFLTLFEQEKLPKHYKIISKDKIFTRSAAGGNIDTLFYQDTVIYKKLLLNNNATKESISKEFQYIARQAKSTDIFVFYFAGMGHAVKINDIEYPFLYTGNFNPKQEINTNIEQPNENTVSPWELNSWLNQIQCKRQLIVSDACSGQSFFNVLFSSNNSGLKNLEKRERIFIGTKGLAYEINEIAGGTLTYCMYSISEKTSILDLFDENNRWRTEYEIYNNRIKLEESLKRSSFGDFKIVYESDILKYLNLVYKEDSKNRGANPFTPSKTKAENKAVVNIKNYALIIGTDEYDEFTQLNNPVLDATTIAKELSENYNFETFLLKNPTKDEIETALYKISQIEFGKSSQLIVFFAGHGIYDETTKEGYIVPKNARKKDNLFRNSYISHSNLRNIINGFNSQHTLVILDICFGGTFSNKMRNAEDDMYKDIGQDELIKRKMKYKSRFYLTSGGKEYVPDGRAGSHSPFASKFIDFLRIGNKTGTFSSLKSHIEKIEPEPRAGSFGSHEPGGDFLFIHH